jgi:UDP-N-acetylglucosamine diphosphorylase / glucose-1-phosphate thymidylyltransferase / UDP-N-acetylgalactosamine diphosphorylase / glucosamine-1-phosphate N-acetyltransferase / galactosamine-1-phosphate N-acetyltransferase
MIALILAAGRGSRMKQLTSATPKHMLLVTGRPVLEHVVTRLRDAGMDRQVIVTGYLGEVIESYFGDGSRFGVRVDYARQPSPTGTGSAVHAAKAAISDSPFLMTFGDVLASTETYQAMANDFAADPCDALLALNWVEDPATGAAVYLDGQGRVTRIVEKPPQGQSHTHWNQSGVFVFSPVVFDYTARLVPSARGEYELTDATNAMLADGRNVRGHCIDGTWCDVGRPEDLGRAEQMLEDEL